MQTGGRGSCQAANPFFASHKASSHRWKTSGSDGTSPSQKGRAFRNAAQAGGRGSCQAANPFFASHTNPHPTADKRPAQMEHRPPAGRFPAQVELRPPGQAMHSGTPHKREGAAPAKPQTCYCLTHETSSHRWKTSGSGGTSPSLKAASIRPDHVRRYPA